MNGPQRWLTWLLLVFLVDEAVEEVALYVLSSSRTDPADRSPNEFRVMMVGIFVATLYFWWRVMRWIDRRALEPQRRTRAKTYMAAALVTGGVQALAGLTSGESQIIGWLRFPWVAACWAVGMTLAGAATPDETVKLMPMLRLVTILCFGCLILDVIFWGYWLAPVFST